MPNREFVTTMARYNMWQNESVITAASELSAEERERERGAFFGSIQKTLSHIFWGDMIWMSRFTGAEAPAGSISQSTEFIKTWDQYLLDRPAFDREIVTWADGVSPEWLEETYSWYSAAAGRQVTKPNGLLAVHLFNHQTHHRGQVHAMLTAAGARPDDTDIPFLPDRFFDQ
ncbi:MAG: DinB family protein [Pseudomonadota bacterium]